MIAVLDASAAVRNVVVAGGAFGTAIQSAELVIAPELIIAEVCNAFRKYVRARVFSAVQAEEAARQALALVDRMEPLRDLAEEVLSLAWRSESSVYDLFYLALAKRTGATLITADLALRQNALKMGVEVSA